MLEETRFYFETLKLWLYIAFVLNTEKAQEILELQFRPG